MTIVVVLLEMSNSFVTQLNWFVGLASIVVSARFDPIASRAVNRSPLCTDRSLSMPPPITPTYRGPPSEA